LENTWSDGGADVHVIDRGHDLLHHLIGKGESASDDLHIIVVEIVPFVRDTQHVNQLLSIKHCSNLVPEDFVEDNRDGFGDGVCDDHKEEGDWERLGPHEQTVSARSVTYNFFWMSSGVNAKESPT
jgi:hypothetical protein